MNAVAFRTFLDGRASTTTRQCNAKTFLAYSLKFEELTGSHET